MSRPELTGHASLFYNEKEARKYHSSSRMVNVQREITLRAIELLLLPQDRASSFILDIGCGSGLSGQVLEEQGHVWVGCDVSRDMLQVAKERMEDSLLTKPDKEMNNDSDEEQGSDVDDDDDDDEPAPSTGDLLHHVSNNKICCQAIHCSASTSISFIVNFVSGYGNRIAISSCHL